MNFLHWREFHCLAASRLLLHMTRRALVSLLFLIRIIPCQGRFVGVFWAFFGFVLRRVFQNLLYFHRRNAIRTYDGAFSSCCRAQFSVSRNAFFVTGLMVFAWSQLRPPIFLEREHDYETHDLDLNFSVLHRVAGAMIPMVRRTGDFIATKSI